MYVFVYGTLKSGHGNNSALDGGKYIESRELKFKEFSMYPVVAGGAYPFPALVNSGVTTPVIGEIWKINKSILNELDRIEGYPNFYLRSTFNLDNREIILYHLPLEYAHFCDLSNPIEEW